MKQVIIDGEAEDELANSVEFYEQRMPGLGLEFQCAAQRAVELIQSHPDRHPCGAEGTRR